MKTELYYFKHNILTRSTTCHGNLHLNTTICNTNEGHTLCFKTEFN